MTYRAAWQSPSNIALVKYWGKHGIQLPRNPSLSFTLSACLTKMTVEVVPEAEKPDVEVYYEGTPRPAFEGKIRAFFGLLHQHFPWLAQASVRIDSTNTFPHGAGIASSASAMSALALCLSDINDQLAGGRLGNDTSWWQHAAEIARLGSGSACRSLFPVAALWGATGGIDDSSDSYAIPWADRVQPFYRDYCDTILIVSSAEKAVSSTAGHELMNLLPYARTRYAEAQRNIERLIDTLASEDSVNDFMTICETEALQLHALMMSGDAPFILMEPGTLAIIKAVWAFRKETGLPVCFTLDAGPNVHLLYPADHRIPVMDFVRTKLAAHCADGRFIEDKVGTGPERLTGKPAEPDYLLA